MIGTLVDLSPPEVAAYYAARVPSLSQQRGAEWRGRCPIHDGKDDNFAVDAQSGRWFCHSACGRGGDIFDLEDEFTGGDFPTRKSEVLRIVGRVFGNPGRGEPTRTTKINHKSSAAREIACYQYEDQDGELAFEVVRYLHSDGSKRFRQRRPDGKGGVVYNLAGVNRVPYRLPRVMQAKALFLVEGEKDVETLERWGLDATCNPGGSGSTGLYGEWTHIFAGKRLAILPDNDAPGRKHAAGVAAALIAEASSIRVIELPGLPEKGDVSDWVEAGGTCEQFIEIVRSAKPIDAVGLAALRARWGVDIAGGRHATIDDNSEWPNPDCMREELPPVLNLSAELIPHSLLPLVLDVAERMQVPVDYPAVVAVLSLAGAVNRRAKIQPKANDTDWVEVPNLWGGIVAPPGFMKSPVIQAITRPLARIDNEWRQADDEAQAGYEGECEEFELRRSAWREQFKANSKKGGVAPPRPDAPPSPPKRRRLIVNDLTFESLHEIMRDNPAGVLQVRDELTGWLSQLDKPGSERDRGFYLQAWNGSSPYTVDRIGRGRVHAETCCLSLLGGIQPARLASYLVDALKNGPGNDGLMQRFQVLVWPDTSPEWRFIDRPPNQAAESQVEQIFRVLVGLDSSTATRYRFDVEAQALFIEWLTELEEKIRGGELHHALISHLSKYRSLMPSLALLFALADAAAAGRALDAVSVHHARQAAGWCDYLESHAVRVYAGVASPQVKAARDLAEKIRSRKVGKNGIFSPRDVYLKNWAGLDSPEVVRLAMDVLLDAGWIRAVESKSADPLRRGRPANRFQINPAVLK